MSGAFCTLASKVNVGKKIIILYICILLHIAKKIMPGIKHYAMKPCSHKPSGGAGSKETHLFQDMMWEKSDSQQQLRLRPVLKVSTCFYLTVFYQYFNPERYKYLQ
jgi:hypothetical protein